MKLIFLECKLAEVSVTSTYHYLKNSLIIPRYLTITISASFDSMHFYEVVRQTRLYANLDKVTCDVMLFTIWYWKSSPLTVCQVLDYPVKNASQLLVDNLGTAVLLFAILNFLESETLPLVFFR